jgi:hypothetical protein
MTFIDEILAEAEIAEEKRKIELDRLRADQLLMAVARLEAGMGDVNKLADDEIRLIEEYRATELARLDKKRSWLVWNLEQYMRSTDDKTIRLPHGILKIRKGRDRIAVVAMDLFLKVGQKLGLLRTIPETYSPDVQAILDHIHRTGEIPPGVEFIPADNRFSYSTNGGSNEREQQAEG